MGKKDFFKFPDKKTLEYILIGILFVAVLSCTMKMMNISFNNILEGFTEYTCPLYTPGDTCNLMSVAEQTSPTVRSYMITNAEINGISSLVINADSGDITVDSPSISGLVANINGNRSLNSKIHAIIDPTNANQLYITEKQRADGTFANALQRPRYLPEETCTLTQGEITITKEGGIYSGGARGSLRDLRGSLRDFNQTVTWTFPSGLSAEFCNDLQASGLSCDSENINLNNSNFTPEQSSRFFNLLVRNRQSITVDSNDTAQSNLRDINTVNTDQFINFLSNARTGNDYVYTISGTPCSPSREAVRDIGTLSTISDCTTLRTRLGRDNGSNSPCIQGCEQQASGTCEDSARNAGCDIQENEGSDPSCVCGPTALNEPGSFNTLPSSFNSENNCLQTQFKDNDNGLITNRNNGELTNRSDEGWATDSGDGDRCLPRWPCIDTMNDYLNILKKTKDQCTADMTTDNWYDNDNTDNEMKVSYCQPFNQNTDFSECNNLTSKGTCEDATDPNSDSDDKICSWNPYCLPRHKGRSLLVAGQRMDDGAIQCQAHLHPRECNSDSENDCYWDWPLAEEINHNRDDDTRKEKLYNIINPTIAEFDTTNCREENGSYLDNIKCSAYTGAITAGPGNRPYGYCPGDGLCDTDGIHGECLYCSSLSLRSGTPDYPGREYVNQAWEIISTPDPDAPNNVNSENCYRIYHN